LGGVGGNAGSRGQGAGALGEKKGGGGGGGREGGREFDSPALGAIAPDME